MVRRTLVNVIEQYLERLCAKELQGSRCQYNEIHAQLKEPALLHRSYHNDILQTEELLKDELWTQDAAADIEIIKW